MYNVFEQGFETLRSAGEIAGIDSEVIEIMAGPMRVHVYRIPLKMDNGARRIFDAYRVQYNDALGPSRDGTRITPDLNLDEVKALGLLMCIKHAAGHIPAGGGKGGIAADTREFSERELERLCRAYIRCLRPAGPAYDVPGADIGTSPRTMAWMLDEHEQISGYHCPAAINDKPPVLGGTLGGEEATGSGVFDLYRQAADALGMQPAGSTVAIQGFGQVGSVAARLFHEAGAKVVAVGDIDGGIYDARGLDIADLEAHVAEAGTVRGYPGAERISNAELLETDCDTLVPAAVQGVLTEDNAPRVRAKLVVEAANAPTTVEADRILLDRGVEVVPDILANSGSVHVCQMERTQGLYDHYWDADTVHRLRKERMSKAYHQARDTAARYRLGSVRLGAWINALRLLQEAIHTRGWL